MEGKKKKHSETESSVTRKRRKSVPTTQRGLRVMRIPWLMCNQLERGQKIQCANSAIYVKAENMEHTAEMQFIIN